ncbi:CHAT domain-containing tetratricopeptide repeat protein [Methanosphaerula palustris]|uniref:Tetratricopeptide domain protein n=1 Tax=Methanosphaerula palustris (strain ATCC BAA-1556 / DSM 19958 / E1-9c) TaxID=521011 RepID=B8GGF4_METPE|nr:CHAT domain-containing protein [Methanosphaerula palustris]ACL16209.1 Tetratricopeptide domain protein [Methanosphaerula palustris E1-9c]
MNDKKEYIEERIQYYLQNLEVYTQEKFPEEWATTQSNLAGAYTERINESSADNIEKAICHYKLALKVFTQSAYPEDWAMTQNNLAIAYINRCYGVKADNIEIAITLLISALKVRKRKASPKEWARTQHNLGIAYKERIRGNKVKNIERSIKHAKNALKVFIPDRYALDYARIQNTLSTAYLNKICGEETDNIDTAIYHANLALDHLNKDEFPNDWAITHNNLGLAFLEKQKENSDTNLKTAITHLNNALSVYTKNAIMEKMAVIHSNLAMAYLFLVTDEREERAENLKLAIIHANWALKVFTTETDPEKYASTLNYLAIAFENLNFGDPSDNIETSIDIYSLIGEVYTLKAYPHEFARTQYNLGIAYSNRIAGNKKENIQEAVSHFQLAQKVWTYDDHPAEHRDTWKKIGDSYFQLQNWNDACIAYYKACEISDNLIIEAYTERGRQNEVGKIANIYSNLAYCQISMGHLPEALVTCEKGKTRLFNETLSIIGQDLNNIPSDKQLRFIKIRKELKESMTEMPLDFTRNFYKYDPMSSKRIKKARNKLKALVKEIKVNNPDFLWTNPDLTTILAEIPEKGAIVVPLITSQGGAVFIVPSGTITIAPHNVLRLNEFDSTALHVLMHGNENHTGWLQTYNRRVKSLESNCEEIKRKALEDWISTIGDISKRLWDQFIGPIFTHLKSLDVQLGTPILITPPGLLKLLPLHAAYRIENGLLRAFLDDYTISYAPSITTISIIKKMKPIQKSEKDRLLMVKPNHNNLYFSTVECKAITSLFGADKVKSLEDKNAVKDMVVKFAQNKQYLHFSTHGYFVKENVMQSGLVLEDGMWTLADILSDLNIAAARMVTLSVCESGIPQYQKIPDEYIGISAGFLHAGASCVISSLWAVNDVATSMLMMKLYSSHLIDGLSPVCALREAQIFIRNATNQEVVNFMCNGNISLDIDRDYSCIIQEPNENQDQANSSSCISKRGNPIPGPFVNPYFWAGFVINGVYK